MVEEAHEAISFFAVVALLVTTSGGSAFASSWSEIDRQFQENSGKEVPVGRLAGKYLIGDCFTSAKASGKSASMAFPVIETSMGTMWFPHFRSAITGGLLAYGPTSVGRTGINFGEFQVVGIIEMGDSVLVKTERIVDGGTQKEAGIGYCEFTITK